MVYADAKTICDVLGDLISDRSSCERRLARFEAMTETEPGDLDERIKSSKVAAVVYTRPGTPECDEQVGTLVRAMESVADLQAFEADADDPAVSERADRDGVDKLPTTVIYVHGERGPTLVGNKSLADVEAEITRAREGGAPRPETPG